MNMTDREFKCFTNDVLDLYCRTKISEVESIFIKLANVAPDTFWRWLLKNNRIHQSLINSSVYDALDTLSHIRSLFSYGQNIDKSTVVRTLNSNTRNMKTMPVILAMNNLIDNEEVKDILQPYRDIIELVASFMSSKDNPIDENDVLQDINTIKNLYFKSSFVDEEGSTDTIKISIQQKRVNMLQNLLTRFSDDTANAAESSGMSELATAIKSGILAKPFTAGLNKYINLIEYDSSDIIFCKKVVEYILKKPQYEEQWTDHNHDTIEMMFMNRSGNLSKEDMIKIIEDYEKKTNTINLIENIEDSSMHPGFDFSDKITVDKRLNPNYLFLLSTFFVILRSRAGLPTGFAMNATY